MLHDDLLTHPPAPQNLDTVAATGKQSSEDSKISRLRGQVDKVKVAMSRNIDVMLANANDLEGLQLRAQELEALSKNFNQSAKDVRRKMLWRRVKATGAVVGITAGCIAAPLLL